MTFCITGISSCNMDHDDDDDDEWMKQTTSKSNWRKKRIHMAITDAIKSLNQKKWFKKKDNLQIQNETLKQGKIIAKMISS